MAFSNKTTSKGKKSVRAEKEGRREDYLEQGYTIEELAQMENVTQGQMYRYLQRRPNLNDLAKRNSRINSEAYQETKELIKQGFTQAEISKERGYINRQNANNMLRNHPELRKLYDSEEIRDKREEKNAF